MKLFLKSPWRIIGAIALIVIVVVLLQRYQLLKPLENVATAGLRPVQTFFSEAARRLRDVSTYFKNNRAALEENAQLKDRITVLTVENQRLKTAITDSELLSEELQFIQQRHYQAVTAKVIGSGSDNYSQVLLLNQGENAGLKPGYPVIVSGGVLVGKIIEVDSQLSKMLILTDNHSQISAVVNNETKSPGLVSGRYSLSLLMDLIPQDQLVSKDQTVTTSGLEQYLPPDLIIGTISAVNKKEGELFQQATVEPSVSYRNLSVVSVIIPSS